MSSPGLSPKNPLKYTGPNVYLPILVSRNRRPTGADIKQPETGKYYSFGSFWLVGQNPTTGVFGDLYYLANIIANVATWVLISSGTGPDAASYITDTGTSFPNNLGQLFVLGQDTPSTSGIQTVTSGNTVNIRMFSPYTLSNFSFIREGIGEQQVVTVRNTSNTAASDAVLKTLVEGSSGGDPILNFVVLGTQTWTMGIDNSIIGDPFTLSSSTALGTNNVLAIDTSGNAFFTNTTAAPQILSNFNIDTSAGSYSGVFATVAAGSAADPFFHVAISTVRNYCFGIDNSDSDILKINTDIALVTPSSGTNLWKMTTAGQQNLPLQPSFNAYVSGDITNATGDSTLYTIAYNAENFDIGGNFATGIFTAPVTGKYLFTHNTTVFNLTGVNEQGLIFLVTTSLTFPMGIINCGDARDTISGANKYGFTGSVIANMTAGDIAAVQIQIFGGAKDIGIIGVDGWANFTGQLIS